MESGGIAPQFLISAQVRGQWRASGPGRFTPRERTLQYPLDRGLDGPQGRSELVENRNSLSLLGMKSRPSSTSVYKLWKFCWFPRFISNIPCWNLDVMNLILKANQLGRNIHGFLYSTKGSGGLWIKYHLHGISYMHTEFLLLWIYHTRLCSMVWGQTNSYLRA
jgi:hypothetical protein